MFDRSETQTLEDFICKPAEHIKRLKGSKRPETLTVNGKAAVVVQDAEAYERMAELAEYAQSIQSIRQALTEEGRPIEQFAKEFEAKHGIKR